MYGYMTDEQFVFFKKRWDGLVKKGLTSLIADDCEKLANIDGLVPILYSAGFDDVQDTPRYKKMKISTKTVFSRHIVFGVKSGHTALFKGFEHWRNKIAFDDWFKVKPILSTGMLHLGSFDPTLERVYFNYWMIEFKYFLVHSNKKQRQLITPEWMDWIWDEMIDEILLEEKSCVDLSLL